MGRSFKKMKQNPLPSPFLRCANRAVKAFNEVGDIYVPYIVWVVYLEYS